MAPVNRREILKYTGSFVSSPLIFSGTVHGQDQRESPEDASSQGLPAKGEGLYYNPVFEPAFADPAVIQDQNGMYYAYATQDNWRDGQGSRYMAMIRSSNLVDWEYIGNVFEDVPSWIETAGFLWAPDIVHYKDKYHLYYSLVTLGDPWERGIGLATAEKPDGQFEDQGVVIHSREIGVNDSIDPHFVYADGTPYMVWGSYIDGIYIIQLSEDGTEPVGEKTPIAGAIPGEDGTVYEGAFIVERNEHFYLFVSTGGCCSGAASGYHVDVGRSESLMGPYVNKQGKNLLDHPGTLVLEGNDAFVGPGHNSTITDDSGQDWIIYHAYEHPNYYIEDQTLRRTLMIDPLKWKDGWPTVKGKEPSSTQRRPVINQKNKPKPELSDLEASPNPVEANELFTVSTTAANSRGVGTVDIGLYLNGDLIESKPTVFDVGETRPVEFTTRLYRPPDEEKENEEDEEKQENDDYEVTIGPSFGQALPEQSVEFIPKSVEFEYTNLDIPEETRTDETARLSVDVQNIGSYEAMEDMPLTVDEETVRTESVTLGPGESTDVAFEYSFNRIGQLAVTIGDADPQTVFAFDPDLVYQAEDASLTNVNINSGQGGYSGSSYVTVNTDDSVASIEWTFSDVSNAGEYTVFLRFAHGGSQNLPERDSHTLSLYINETDTEQIAFPNTGGWGVWEMLDTSVQLDEGQNTIALQRDSDDTGGVNIDYIATENI